MYLKKYFIFIKGKGIRATFCRIFSSSCLHLPLKKSVKFETLPRAFKPGDVERGWYDWWEAEGHFKPASLGQPFTMILPPPNVTGILHLGHALATTIQDVLARWRRMSGDSVLWIPGMDHAGIATQVVVEKSLYEQRGVSKHDIGREEFLRHAWAWKDEKGGRIVQQLRHLGASLDWSAHVFTMDPMPSSTVNSAFIELFDRGLIYRADSLVNWSCALQSSISDVEVESMQVTGPTLISVPKCQQPVEFGVLHHIAYRVENEDAEIVVATTRPETLLGDTAVCLHPEDCRRTWLEGKHVWHPTRQCAIPIIFDSHVDPAFGTGALKVTPLHDADDFALAIRHNLDKVQIFDVTGSIITGHWAGKQRFDVRREILSYLQDQNLYRGKKDHNQTIPVCSRSGDVVEQMLKPQWWLRCGEAARRAMDAVDRGDLVLVPDNYERVWTHWLGEMRDWNISRQLWWGHRIPAYLVTHGEQSVWVAAHDVQEARVKGSKKLGVAAKVVSAEPDPDVLDTWFSSGLFPLYSLGCAPRPGVPSSWLPPTDRFPISLLETGHDILFFWVARMVMLSYMLTGNLPFKKVLLHGVICDARGRKMSKSLGNVLTPEQIVHGASLAELTQGMDKDSAQQQAKLFPEGIPECGTDALRFTLTSQSIHSSNVGFDVTTCHTNKLFCNKILQATKFTLSNMQSAKTDELCWLPALFTTKYISGYDRWILSRLAAAVQLVNSALEDTDFHLANQALKNFLYYEFCDIYLEAVKPVLKKAEQLNSDALRASALSTLLVCIDTGLRLLHPWMPYLTEELYQCLPSVPDRPAARSIMIAPFPRPSDYAPWRCDDLEVAHTRTHHAVQAARKLKALYGTKGHKPDVIIVTQCSDLQDFIETNAAAVKFLSRTNHLTIQRTKSEQHASWMSDTLDEQTTVYVDLSIENGVLMKRLAPIMKKEQKLREQINKLQSRQMSPEGEQTLKTLQLELKKIVDLKEKLQLATSMA